MKTAKTILSVVFFLLVLAYALAFAVHNNQSITLDFLIGSPISWPAPLWLGLVLLCGTLLGILSGAFIYTRQKLHIRRLHKELRDTQQRLSKIS